MRNSLFVALRARTVNAGALRAEHMAFIKSHFGEISVSLTAWMPGDSTQTKTALATTAVNTNHIDTTSPSPLEQDFYPRFAHDLAILVLARDVQIPLAANGHPPLDMCISRALHNKELLDRVEARQAIEPLTFSQLDFLTHHMTPDSHSLLRRTVCEGLVRLLETQAVGMTH